MANPDRRPEPTWQTTETAFAIQQDGVTVVLSMTTGRYYRLNATAQRVWPLLQAGVSEVDAVKLLIREYPSISPEVLKRDVGSMLTNLERSGIVWISGHERGAVQPAPASARRVPRPLWRVPGVAYFAFHLLLVQVALRLRASKVLLERLRIPIRSNGASPDVVATALRRSLLAAALVPVQTLCLPRSLSLALILRRLGADARLRIGATSYPFYAHAWVELDGVPVNETPDSIDRFEVFALESGR